MAGKKNIKRKTTGKAQGKNTTGKSKVADGTISQATDTLGREVRHFVQNGVHHVEANRNGATHPVECSNAKEAKELFKEECAVE